MTPDTRRKTPEDFLREAQAEERAARQGRLKIFLGYASGVGKSLRMFDEARRRRERGQDIVVAAVQPRVPVEVDALLRNLEVIPLKSGGDHAAIDMDALMRRNPAVCVVDGLAYDNPPGSRNPTRWQDVQDLLGAGMKVIGSINIQYIAELSEQVEAITGKHVTETVPVAFIKSADEIELVDAPADQPKEGSPEERLDAARQASNAFQSCGSWRWCWRRMWWTISSTSIWSVMGSATASAHRSGFWCALRRAPTPEP